MSKKDATLADTLSPGPVSFEVGGRTYYVRPPTPEEYDEAITIFEIAKKRALASTELADLKDAPMSDEEKETYKMAVEMTTERLKEVEAGTPEEERLLTTRARLMEIIETTSLAEELAAKRAVIKRDRWLTMRLLCRRNGSSIFDTNDPKSVEKFQTQVSPAIRQAAREHVVALLQGITDLPFDWDQEASPG